MIWLSWQYRRSRQIEKYKLFTATVYDMQYEMSYIHHIKKCMYMISIGPWKYVIYASCPIHHCTCISSQGIRAHGQTNRDLQRDLWPDMRVICLVFSYVPSGLRSGHLLWYLQIQLLRRVLVSIVWNARWWAPTDRTGIPRFVSSPLRPPHS